MYKKYYRFLRIWCRNLEIVCDNEFWGCLIKRIRYEFIIMVIFIREICFSLVVRVMSMVLIVFFFGWLKFIVKAIYINDVDLLEFF